MGVLLKFELAPVQPRPEEDPGGYGDNEKRYGLLPIHAGKINHASRFATTFIETSADSGSRPPGRCLSPYASCDLR